jgi:DNA-binding CsgD family transcriptional regulator
MQLLVGAARRVWWRDPGPAVRHEVVHAAQQVDVGDGDPRLLAVLALSESNERGPAIIDRLSGWPDDAGGRPDLAGLLGIAAFCTGDFRRAVGFLSTPVQELRAQGRMSLLAEALAIRSWAEIYLGVFDAAISADEAMRLADETGQSLWAATSRIAVALIDTVNRGGNSHHLLTEAEHVALRTPNAASSLLAGVQLARGIAALGANRDAAAYDELRRVFDRADPAYQRVQQVWTLGILADAAVRTDRRAEARSALAAVERIAGDSPATGATINLEYTRAVLADRTTAEPLFRAAVDGAARGLPWHRARAEFAYGSWLRRQRRVVESRAPLRAARAAFEAVGARTWARQADQELRATGERGWQPTSSRRELLSPQETQIADLAAQGLSNREIGQRLFLSHRTVSSHLYRMFPKLGVTSRGQLAAALTQLDDASGVPTDTPTTQSPD